METYSLATITKALYDSHITCFTTKTLRDLVNTTIQPSTFFSLLKKLEKSRVLEKVERNKYILLGKTIPDFTLANFLYEPSYISLESALNYYGILSQFPHEITSITPKKPIGKIIQGKTYRYGHIQHTLYWGYEQQGEFLIAQPEKALLDLLYMHKKGLASVHVDEYDIERLDKQRFRAFRKKFPPMEGVLPI